MVKEIFVDVHRFKGFYKCSSHGRFLNVLTGKYLKLWKDPKGGYLHVRFFKNGKKTAVRNSGRVILESFIPKPNSGENLECAHKDGNSSNNNISNLMWASRKLNSFHKIAHGTQLYGERHHSSKMTKKEVVAIKQMLRAGMYVDDVSQIMYKTNSTIFAINIGKTWKSINIKYARTEEWVEQIIDSFKLKIKSKCVTKAEIARRGNCSKPTIQDKCVKGGVFEDAVLDNGKINLNHPNVKKWLKKRKLAI